MDATRGHSRDSIAMSTQDQAILIKLMAEIASTSHRIPLDLDASSAFALLSTLQLALRHPHFVGPTSHLIHELARGLQAELSIIGPTVRLVCERGWDKAFDA